MLVAHIVTYNHEQVIAGALTGLIKQTGPEFKIWVTDNASTDDTCEVVRRFSPRVELIELRENTGFTGAHNLGFARALREQAEAVLVLNPDVFLEPDALEVLHRVLRRDPRCGTICPKLLRAGPDLKPIEPLTFDSTGMFITPEIRHFDRGSNERDCGQFEAPEYVFGASGAAMLCSSRFLKDIAYAPDRMGQAPQVFDDLFFAYREDADLAWRAQWQGWKCRYEPHAKGYHLRRVLPENRSSLPPELNAYSVRNRLFLQVNNIFSLQQVFSGAIRNCLVLLGVQFREKSSLPALHAAQATLPVSLRHREQLKRRRRATPRQLQTWFSKAAHAEPALDISSREGSRPTEMPTVTIVIVNYNSGNRLTNCVQQLSSVVSTLAGQMNIVVNVIDNASSDGSAENLPQEILLERSDSNLGFAGAINKAAKAARGEFLCILNPDIHLSADALAQLVSTLQAHPDLAAAAPVLLDHSGLPQWNYLARNFPTLGSTLSEFFGLHRVWPTNPWTQTLLRTRDRFLRRYVLRSHPKAGAPYESLDLPLLVKQPAAACLLVRATDFETLGGFDATFWPAWFEDVDFCKRLFDNKRKCAIVSAARVKHEGGYSYRFLGRAEFAKIWFPNLLRYWKKHGSGGQYAIIRTLLVPALVSRACFGYFKSLTAKDDSAQWRNYASTLFALAFRTTNRPH